jgi:hypothetical protein
MKNGIIGLALLGVIISANPTRATPLDYKGPGRSGYATNALVKAYEAN